MDVAGAARPGSCGFPTLRMAVFPATGDASATRSAPPDSTVRTGLGNSVALVSNSSLSTVCDRCSPSS